MTMTRTLCPLDCGWHHDQPDFDPSVPQPFASEPGPDGVDPIVWGFLLGGTLVVENALKAHLETHELIEWVKALNLVKGERDLYRKEVGVSHQESQKLREMLGREDEATQDAQAQVARIRAFLEDMAGWCSPHGIAADYAQRGLDALDGVDPLGLAGPTREELQQ